MARYDNYGQVDSPPVEDGDLGFTGVDEYNTPDNIQPGMVQGAVNMDFTVQAAVTRGGFVCLPALGSAPFGSTWTSRTSAADNDWRSVAYGNGIFVAVARTGVGNRVMTSTDGATWTIRTSANDYLWWSVCFGQGMFVAVANQGLAQPVMTSTDGTTWTARTGGDATVGWTAVCYGAGTFVAVGGSGTNRSMSSTDGITWTSHSISPVATWNGVAYGGGKYVAVADTGAGERAAYSTDGATWTAGNGTVANAWNGVAYGNGVFVAVSSSGTGNRVMSSADGITWTSRTSAANNAWNSVTFGNGVFIAVASSGTGNRIMISYDGTAWSTLTDPVDDDWQGVVVGGSTAVAVAWTGTGDRVMTWQTTAVYASAIYSDPNDAGSQWIMLCGATQVGFYAFGRQSRSVSYGAGLTVSAQSTIVQCNNLVYIFRGSSAVPLYWTGSWGDTFALAPTSAPAPGFSIIPNSNQATYYQNRLWVINGKDTVSASDVLSFNTYDNLANAFNVNTGSSDYLVTTFPFGTTTLIAFKNKSILALSPVSGVLSSVVASEITRQVGCIGINAVVSVGSDIVYMSDRNINLISLTDTNNALQHKTLPLSTNIKSIIGRVNWTYGYKVSMAYWDNKLFVALPLDNATSCNTVCVYNFVTEQWFGEWNFSSSINMQIQGWAVATYLGATRLHAVTEDGRIFVFEGGQNDVSGATVAEISASMTTRAYHPNNDINIPRRMYADLSTNRPNYTITAYADGASESSVELSGQTYSRATSWLWADSAYDLTNANDDFNRQGRQDYSTGPNSVQCGTGFQPEMTQDFRIPLITRRKSRLAWFKIANSTGVIWVNGIGMEARTGDRSNLTQVI